MKNALSILCILLFESSTAFYIALKVLYLIGLWRLLEKSGLKGWWALIPGARDYQLARCAGREPEGRVYSLTGVAAILLSLQTFIVELPQDFEASNEIPSILLIAMVALLILSFVRFIYTIPHLERNDRRVRRQKALDLAVYSRIYTVDSGHHLGLS